MSKKNWGARELVDEPRIGPLTLAQSWSAPARYRLPLHICGDEPPVSDDSTCPLNDRHTPAPKGYLAWQVWAAQMARTHAQKQCPACGLWKIWEAPEKAK